MAATVLLVLSIVLCHHYQKVMQADLAFKEEQQQYRVYKSPSGKRSVIRLADHSKVILNGNSTLKVPHAFPEGNRKVVLSGAAYFEISGNARLPFILETSDMKVTVSGASFYMRAYPHESGQQLELLSGKLKAEKAYTSDIDNTAEILLPGEMVMLNRSVDLMEKETFNIQQRESWIKGQLKFNNAGFSAVVTALEDWYGLPVEIQGVQKSARNFSGNFGNQPLEQVLKMFCLAANCNFKIEKAQVILSLK
ncbi:FecR family protein [Pedobacter sp. PLR]|uniref:FecR family protein n=1 Tax=Pedobacter sp. PLR TaxID=2994465 RepID=UPI002246D2FF|nr:FecR family protein [Pedobacter sp. PLR]MCX2454105.1 FecR family protein [Pedobacter sp. PLR]